MNNSHEINLAIASGIEVDCMTTHKYSQLLKPCIKYLKYHYLDLDGTIWHLFQAFQYFMLVM